MSIGIAEANNINIKLFKIIILAQKIEVNKRNPTIQDRKAKRLYKIVSYNLFTRMHRENPRKGSRERAVENIRGKIASIFRINEY